jgi:hypothetical protein
MAVLALLTLLRAIPIIFFCMLAAPYTHAQTPPVIKVRSEGTVSVQVVNVPLNEVLAILAKSVPMDIKGDIPSQELVTLGFSNLSLEEALRRIMRGYNYVLVHMDEPARPVLTVMNRTERIPYVEEAPAAVAPPEPAGRPPRPRAPVPPGGRMTSPEQGQDPSAATARRGEIEQARPSAQDGRIGPPGIAGSPAGQPPGVGAFAPGPVVQPRPARQAPAETTGEAPPAQQPPAEPREPTQPQQAEPTVVMTPFGYRTEEPETLPQPAAQAPQPSGTGQPRRYPPGMMPPAQSQ